jgi:hypothetical protein
MKQFTESELENAMQTEFQRGFEAARIAAIKICRTQDGITYPKTATECANEIARLRIPRFKGEQEK